MAEVFLASRNRKKLEELERILAPALCRASRCSASTTSSPTTSRWRTSRPSRATRLLKARAGLAATGLPSLADDSGLCVEALNGMPGVLSARWAGVAKDDAANNRLLLEQLADVPDERRGAEFRCVVAFCVPDGVEHVAPGAMPGRVIRELRGDNGFGYDVLFVPDEQDRRPHLGRDDRRGQGPDLPPGPLPARHRPSGRRRAAPLTVRPARVELALVRT